MITKHVEKIKKELVSRNSSRKTVRTYIIGLQTFWRFYRKPLYLAKKEDFRNFKIHLLNKRKEPKTVNTYLAGVKFFYREIMHRKIRINNVQEKQKLVKVLSKDDIKEMIDSRTSLKHKLVIALMYSSGLRVSEVVKIKFEDLNLDNNTAIIRQGKGRKDRVVDLSDTFIGMLKDYDIKRGYIFPGRKGKLSIRSVQEIVNNAAKTIGKKANPHMLRSSFATHCFNSDQDSSRIQKSLGHASIKTLEKYVRIEKPGIKSPLDL